MDYQKSYKETLDQYYLLNLEILSYKREDEKFDIIFDFFALIGKYEEKLIKMKIAKEDNKEILRLEGFISRLMNIYNHFGIFYYHEKINARKLFKVQQELIELQAVVTKLVKENNTLKKINEF